MNKIHSNHREARQDLCLKNQLSIMSEEDIVDQILADHFPIEPLTEEEEDDISEADHHIRCVSYETEADVLLDKLLSIIQKLRQQLAQNNPDSKELSLEASIAVREYFGLSECDGTKMAEIIERFMPIHFDIKACLEKVADRVSKRVMIIHSTDEIKSLILSCVEEIHE